MRNLVIIQARCGSSRLPQKVMKDLEGKPVLQHVIERVKKANFIDEVVVATTCNLEDLQIVNLVSGLGVRVFIGSSSDVLDRYYQSAKLLKPDYIIRITADCPLIDYEIIDDMIMNMSPELDYIAAMSETLADGLDVEIIKYEALYKSWQEAHLSHEREHVTMYIKNHKDIFKTKDYICKLGNLINERWTLDEPEDYEFIKAVYQYFSEKKQKDFLTRDILYFLQEHPEVRKINSGFIRNEGLKISLENDHFVDIEALH